MGRETQIRWLDLTNFALGATLVWGAILFSTTSQSAANAVVVGTAIAAISVVAFNRYTAWAEWSNLFLGGWTVMAPFALGFDTVPAPLWVHLIIGASVATISAVQLQVRRKGRAASASGAAASR
jgi:hypothetical protein